MKTALAIVVAVAAAFVFAGEAAAKIVQHIQLDDHCDQFDLTITTDPAVGGRIDIAASELHPPSCENFAGLGFVATVRGEKLRHSPGSSTPTPTPYGRSWCSIRW